MRSARLFSGAGNAEKRCAAARQPVVLRLGRAAVSARDACGDRAGLCLRPADRKKPRKAAGRALSGAVGAAESGDAGVFQVRRFYDPESQRADGPVCPAAFARAAGRHQLLYLPDPELYRRRVPRDGPGTAEPDRSGSVYRHVPAAHRRTDRPLFRYRAGAAQPYPHAFGRGGRDAALRAGAGKEDLVCQSAWRAGVRLPRLAGAVSAVFLVGRGRVHAADLLRFFRLQRYGHRSRPHPRLSLSGKLPLSLLRRQHHGILAAVAYFPWQLVPGLSLYPAGRQPEGERTAAAEHSSRLAGDRPVARGGLDVRSVGTSVCGAADGRKAVFAARAEKAPRAQPHLCAAVRHARLRAL